MKIVQLKSRNNKCANDCTTIQSATSNPQIKSRKFKDVNCKLTNIFV